MKRLFFSLLVLGSLFVQGQRQKLDVNLSVLIKENAEAGRLLYDAEYTIFKGGYGTIEYNMEKFSVGGFFHASGSYNEELGWYWADRFHTGYGLVASYKIPLSGMAYIRVSVLPGVYENQPNFEWNKNQNAAVDAFGETYGETFEEFSGFTVGGAATFELDIFDGFVLTAGVVHFDLIGQSADNNLIITAGELDIESVDGITTSVSLASEERKDYVPLFFTAGIGLRLF